MSGCLHHIAGFIETTWHRRVAPTWHVLASCIAIVPLLKPKARRLGLLVAQSSAATPKDVAKVHKGLLGFFRDQMHTHPFCGGPKASCPYPTARMLLFTWSHKQRENCLMVFWEDFINRAHENMWKHRKLSGAMPIQPKGPVLGKSPQPKSHLVP